MGAADSKQGAFADLEGVLEMFEVLRNIFLHLAESLHVWINLPQQEVHDVEDIFAHGAGHSLRGYWVFIAVCTEVLYEGAYAVMLIGFVADRSGILLWPCGLFAVRAGSPLHSREHRQSAIAWPGSQ